MPSSTYPLTFFDITDISALGDMDVFSARSIGDLNGDGIGDLLTNASEPNVPAAERLASAQRIVFGTSEAQDLNAADGVTLGTGQPSPTRAFLADIPLFLEEPLGDHDGDGNADLLIYNSSDTLPADLTPITLVASDPYLVLGGWSNAAEVASRFDDADPAGFAVGLGKSGAFETLPIFADLDGDGDDEILRALFNPTEDGAIRIQVVDGQTTPSPAGAIEDAPIGAVSVLDVPLADLGYPEGVTVTGLAALGDLNGDGRDDFGISAAFPFDSDISTQGAFAIVYGGTSIETSIRDGSGRYTLLGASSNERLGWYQAIGAKGVGDVDGDGLGDYVLTAFPNSGSVNQTEAYLVFGGAERGSSLLPLSRTQSISDLLQLQESEGGRVVALQTGARKAVGALNTSFDIIAGGDVNGDGLNDFGLGFYDLADGTSGFHMVYGDADLAAPGVTALNLDTLRPDQGFTTTMEPGQIFRSGDIVPVTGQNDRLLFSSSVLTSSGNFVEGEAHLATHGDRPDQVDPVPPVTEDSPGVVSVTTLDDIIDADPGQTSLREAVIWANAQASLATIVLPSGKVRIDTRNSDLSPLERVASEDDLDILGDVTIRGQADGSSTIVFGTAVTQSSGGGFQVHGGAALALETLTLETGSSGLNRNGGAIYNQGDLRLAETEIRGFELFHSRDIGDRIERNGKLNLITEQSKTPNVGGAIFNDAGSVDITSSTFADNVASLGGAIASRGGDVTISDTAFDGNAVREQHVVFETFAVSFSADPDDPLAPATSKGFDFGFSYGRLDRDNGTGTAIYSEGSEIDISGATTFADNGFDVPSVVRPAFEAYDRAVIFNDPVRGGTLSLEETVTISGDPVQVVGRTDVVAAASRAAKSAGESAGETPVASIADQLGFENSAAFFARFLLVEDAQQVFTDDTLVLRSGSYLLRFEGAGFSYDGDLVADLFALTSPDGYEAIAAKMTGKIATIVVQDSEELFEFARITDLAEEAADLMRGVAKIAATETPDVADLFSGPVGGDLAPFTQAPPEPVTWQDRATNPPGAAPTDLSAIRDYDGKDLGGAAGWALSGAVDIQFDGDAEYVYFNPTIERWATVGPDASGAVDWSAHAQGGDTRVVGIYIDPLVASGEVEAFSDFDSQRRFQNDLAIDNLTVIDAFDFDGDGLQEIYFKVNDGTAYLRALMHADGNIQYANYQSAAQVDAYLTEQGFGSDVLEAILV